MNEEGIPLARNTRQGICKRGAFEDLTNSNCWNIPIYTHWAPRDRIDVAEEAEPS